MVRNLDIALLRTFAAVADRGSMTGAGELLHITQGAVSQQIARLEGLAGTALLLRDPRGMRLTPAGERLLGRARALIAYNDEVWSEMDGGVVTGPVRLGLPYDLVGTWFAPAVKAFCEAFPQVELTLVCAPSPDLLSALKGNELDVAVVEEEVGKETGETLAIDRLVWVGARGGRAHARTPLPISLVADTCIFRPAVLSALSRKGHESRTVFENGGLDATRTVVRMDLAVSAWLASTVPADLDVITSETDLPVLPNFAVTLHVGSGTKGKAIEELVQYLRKGATKHL